MKPFAFVFPGQGSQSVGMLDGWADHVQVREALAEASEALGEDMARLIKDGPKEALALTTNTQPVMLVAGVAAYRVWMAEVGVAPQAVAGHSLGEYSALVAAGVLTLAQAAPLVRFRAQAMQQAVPVGQGAMAAILGLDASKVIAGCAIVTRAMGENSSEVVEAVNFNDPGQTVIAGSKAAVEKACVTLKEMGAKRALPLPVSAPFHSSLMKPAALKLKAKLDDTVFAAPQLAVVNNIDVAVEHDADRMRDALYRQAFGPVRWVECVQAMAARGLPTLVECGPGKVLAGMTRRINPDMQGLPLFDTASLAEVNTFLMEA
ncbi:MAG: ACP S-malonyltransferase [Rhodoferax sp.]|nr:ACP S-malonyltransferase [Betaproteobacteria bacterium]NCN97387.1 ACP S-malonyltransferase [Rhodoferax sp.]OIP16852.1 MAG: [acyl-carrier-protein] S-malonyltransferase [Comamonadaceae bacterium CG2_30_57_122]PIZ22968.1 MAG: [acyl-carrier-protein] S-malonyltransferase [Comamonadaceae bacterium CG_4_10_14_0_8_um_filter_57_29]PJC19967.1 MAG: [acyl-carrier-protein] S-malonyltransferase [Comamonadaceae bacterium CG_4_9_14_0_8_um_filter_57_21]